jgi:hypothetical protein
MKKIHKLVLAKSGDIYEMEKDSEILCSQIQDGWPVIWYLCTPSKQMEKREIVMYGTGWEIKEPEKHIYISTFQKNGLVFHIFEKVK